MTYAHNRELRERLYRASLTRASGNRLQTDPQTGDTKIVAAPSSSTAASGSGVAQDADNTALLTTILEARTRLAALLGYKCYAELSLAKNKQVTAVSAIDSFLEQLRAVSLPVAKDEWKQLQSFADSESVKSGQTPVALAHWDTGYWAERMRKAQFEINDEMLRPYFPLPKVLRGLWALAERVFGVVIREVKGVDVWHPTVQYFEVCERTFGSSSASLRPIAGFYIDPYSRPATKRGGAWMDVCISRSKAMAQEQRPSTHPMAVARGGAASVQAPITLGSKGQSVRMPIAYLICNQSPPTSSVVDGKTVEQPSLMTFRDVETLFHEFGHCLQVRDSLQKR